MNAIATAEDRTMRVPRGCVVRTAWVPIHRVRVLCRDRMSPEAVEAKFRRVIQQGDDGLWPPPVGRWSVDEDGAQVFDLADGRHEFVASIMAGRREQLVAWVAEAEGHRAPH